MKNLLRLSANTLLLSCSAFAGGIQGQVLTNATALEAALKRGDLPEARRQALVAIDQALAILPSCGTVGGLGNPTHFAFPPGEARRVFIQKYGLIGYFDIRLGKVQRIWSIGLADGNATTVSSTNSFTKFFAKSGKLNVDFQCGKQPTYSGPLTLFEVTVPPGNTTAGSLSSDGKFIPLLTREFDTKTKVPKQSIYEQWIIPLPDHR